MWSRKEEEGRRFPPFLLDVVGAGIWARGGRLLALITLRKDRHVTGRGMKVAGGHSHWPRRSDQARNPLSRSAPALALPYPLGTVRRFRVNRAMDDTGMGVPQSASKGAVALGTRQGRSSGMW